MVFDTIRNYVFISMNACNMFALIHGSEEVLRARYRSLLQDVPVAILTALCAIVIQIIAFHGSVDWKLSTLFPLLRMLVASAVLLYWFTFKNDTPSLSLIRKRMWAIGAVMMISALLNFNRNLQLLAHTGSDFHYFMIFHTTMYGLCFAFILSRMGIMAYLFNFIFISSALQCIFYGQVEHRYALTALLIMFEVGMLVAMHTSNKTFNRLVTVTTDTQQLLEENQRLAYQDELTQLPNRRLFFQQLEAQLSEAKRKQEGFAVGILDLDQFKPVNDQCGHHTGDQVLKVIGTRLLSLNTAHLQCYRLGGDEFAFLIQGDVRAQVLHALANTLNQTIHQPIQVHAHTFKLFASIGACLYGHDAASGQLLYEQADAALYQAKRQGGAQLMLFTDMATKQQKAS